MKGPQVVSLPFVLNILRSFYVDGLNPNFLACTKQAGSWHEELLKRRKANTHKAATVAGQETVAQVHGLFVFFAECSAV